MATTVHLPSDLLEPLNARAEALGVSRNRLIVEAVSAALEADDEWSPELLAMLESPLKPEDTAALDEMTLAIQERRTRKAPPDLG